MGARRPALRHHHHLVPGRRRPLYGLHLHRRAGARLRRRRHRLLRGALHDHDLSDPVPGVSAAVARLPQAQLHHAGRFRARPLRQSLAGAGRRPSPASSRPCPISPCSWSACRSSSAALGVSGTGYVGDLPLVIAFIILAAFTYSSGLARAGLDRHRQGHSDLHHGLRRGDRRADRARRLRQDLRRGAGAEAAAGRSRRQHHRLLRRLRDAGARLGAGAVPLSAFASPAY